jgi:predicted signal transduction protein with EAL and GGDEF domain
MMPLEPGLAPWVAAERVGTDWLEALDEPAWLVDATSLRLVSVNKAAADWLDQPASSLLGRAAEELLATLEDAAFWTEARAGHVGRLLSDLELPLSRRGVVQVQRSVMPLGQAPVHSYLVRLRDRSAEHRAQCERETVLAELRATLEATADGILVTDLQGRITAFNRRFATLWELPEAALAGRCDDAIFDWMRLALLEPEVWQVRRAQIARQLMLSASDSVTLLSGVRLVCQTQPQWQAGRPIGRVWSFRPQEPARLVAQHDNGVVGVDATTLWPNRAGLLAEIDPLLARRQGSSLALLCVQFDRQALFSVDGQSRVRALAELIEGLRACVSSHCRIARLGGARFAVLLQEGGEAAAQRLAARLLALATHLPTGLLATEGLALQVGIATLPAVGLCGEDLLARAEQALHRANHAGQPEGHVDHGLSEDDHGLLARLQSAVREDLPGTAFRIHYQPRVDARSGQVVAAEALLRWLDVERGMQLPSQFLPLAQRHDLGAALDDWILEHALHQVVAWRAAGMALRVSVNVSAMPLAQPGYARRVAALLVSTGCPAQALELDINEAALQQDPEAALLTLGALRRLGVRLVLDQFGAGDSSLALLRRCPFHAVKIDRGMTRSVQRGGADSAVTTALIRLAQALHLEVLVVGVENETQRRFMVDAGCDAWQGHYFAPAMDVRGFEICAKPLLMPVAANEPDVTPSSPTAQCHLGGL